MGGDGRREEEEDNEEEEEEKKAEVKVGLDVRFHRCISHNNNNIKLIENIMELEEKKITNAVTQKRAAMTGRPSRSPVPHQIRDFTE